MFMFIFVYICLLAEFVTARGSSHLRTPKGADHATAITSAAASVLGEDPRDVASTPPGQRIRAGK